MNGAMLRFLSGGYDMNCNSNGLSNFGGNNWWWIIILILIFSCGNNGYGGCGNDCGCC